jgi:hypothetical protein
MKIKERNNALFFPWYYSDAKYGDPCLLNLDDDLHEEDHPSPPSHEPLFPNISELENDEEKLPHVEYVKKFAM